MPVPCDHDSRPFYEKLIEPLRDVARRLGYAIAVHGTLKRDIDLVAIPWTCEACSARTLAKSIQHKAREIVGYAEPSRFDAKSSNPKYFRDGHAGYAPGYGQITAKAHGRRVWSFHLIPEENGPYIDLSVMPRKVGG